MRCVTLGASVVWKSFNGSCHLPTSGNTMTHFYSWENPPPHWFPEAAGSEGSPTGLQGLNVNLV